MSEPWRLGLPAHLIPHGTIGGYTNWRCRCTECRKANAVAVKAWRMRKAREAMAHGGSAAQPNGRPHGWTRTLGMSH